MNDPMFQSRDCFTSEQCFSLFGYRRLVGFVDHAKPQVRVRLVILEGVTGYGHTVGAVDRTHRLAVFQMNGIDIIRDRTDEFFVTLFALT